MLTALEQKKFIDWFVENIFQPSDEIPQVYSTGTPELKTRLRFLCYKGLREATVDFWDFDKKLMRTPVTHKGGVILTANHPDCPSETMRCYEFFSYDDAVEKRVKEQLIKDSIVKPYLSSKRPESIFELSQFEGECENIAILAARHYAEKLHIYVVASEEQIWK